MSYRDQVAIEENRRSIRTVIVAIVCIVVMCVLLVKHFNGASPRPGQQDQPQSQAVQAQPPSLQPTFNSPQQAQQQQSQSVSCDSFQSQLDPLEKQYDQLKCDAITCVNNNTCDQVNAQMSAVDDQITALRKSVPSSCTNVRSNLARWDQQQDQYDKQLSQQNKCSSIDITRPRNNCQPDESACIQQYNIAKQAWIQNMQGAGCSISPYEMN